MKTAISLKGPLLTEADRAAREIGVSRSRLFSLALEHYLRKREQDRILDRLNRVYGGPPDEAEKQVLPQVKKKFRLTIKDPW